MTDAAIREHLKRALEWGDARATFEQTVGDLPSTLRGKRPDGMPHSPWELLEHLRLAQQDILEFCVNPNYKEREWPADYWPKSPEPPDNAAWDASVQHFLDDRKALQDLASNTSIDLAARIPHGSGQTYLRELLLIVDHNAYHLGQLVLVRRMLGAWKS